MIKITSIASKQKQEELKEAKKLNHYITINVTNGGNYGRDKIKVLAKIINIKEVD